MTMTFENVIKHFTTRGLRVEDVRQYLEAGGDINHQDAKMLWTLLHFAAEDRNTHVIELLATRGAHLDLKDRNGWTPLHVAVDSDLDTSGTGGRPVSDMPTVQMLINAGADEFARTAAGEAPEDMAASYGQLPLFHSLSRRKTG